MKANKILLGFLLFLAFAVAANAAPDITVPGPTAVNENEQVQFTITATAADNGSNVFGTDATVGVFIQLDETSATFTWTPTYDDADVYVFEFSVADTDSSDSDTTVVTVVNVNRAPSITSSAVKDVEVDDEYYYNVEATDPDSGDTLTYTLVSSPVGMTIDSDNGEIRWSPDATNIDGNSVKVKVSDGKGGEAEQSFSIDVVALQLDRLEVTVEGDSERLDDRDKFDVKPGDELSFEFRLENLYSGDTDEEEVDIEDIEIRINIDEWEDGKDEDWDSDRFDIRYDDKETITIDLGKIPIDISDGKQEVTIEIEGEDEEGNTHELKWTVFMDVDKEREDIRLSSFSLEPSTVSCNRNPLLVVRLVNAGSRDSDEIVFEAKNTALGVSIQDYNIDLDEGDSETLEFQLRLMSDVAPGTYNIRVSSFFDLDDFDDQDVSDSENVHLTVQKCVVEEPEEEEEEEPVVVILPTGGVTIPVEPEVKPLLSVENAYLAGLILVNILLILGIVFLVVKLLTR